jgi:hypothetical protein
LNNEHLIWRIPFDRVARKLGVDRLTDNTISIIFKKRKLVKSMDSRFRWNDKSTRYRVLGQPVDPN